MITLVVGGLLANVATGYATVIPARLLVGAGSTAATMGRAKHPNSPNIHTNDNPDNPDNL